MERLLLRRVRIVDVERGTISAPMDVFLAEGRIAGLGPALEVPSDTPERDFEGRAYVSIGWMDMHVHLREPGQEHKETIATGCRAATFGGFTALACMPNTIPPLHTRDAIEFVYRRAAYEAVDVYPIGCVSKNREGRELAELWDLAQAGAVAFSDDGAPIWHAGLMRRALEYARMLGRPIINHMEEPALSADGVMHEGAVSTRLGLKGIPAEAETAMLARDLELAARTGGHLHVAHLSTARGVELVRRAKAEGVPVTAEVCPHHIALTDEAVAERAYDPNTKMNPPLRTAQDVAALKAGLVDGTIDVIATDHAPHAPEEKEVEFSAAPFGIIGLETAWGLIVRELIRPGVLSLVEALRKITIAPRRILNLPIPRIAVAEPACLTVFDIETTWTVEPRHIRSRSRNTPFIGQSLVGRAWAIYNRGQWIEEPP
ncbi:MAG: dihydroorotase [Bacteroidetes bacterium]|nr:dihydroorotase [Bacteroidota bacterium]